MRPVTFLTMTTDIQTPFALVIHGGAFFNEAGIARQDLFLAEVLRAGRDGLRDGGTALDVAIEAVRRLEDCGHFIAGKGAGPNNAGYHELDAAIMDGATGAAGAVASLRHFRNPVLCARKVMDESPHVLLVAEGAEHFLDSQKIARLDDPQTYFQPVSAPRSEFTSVHGTVGAVTLDIHGHLASAVSTGGLTGKFEGRVGDVPLIGAAIYADDEAAVCSTGHGEYFIRAVAAHDVISQCRYAGLSLDQAMENTMERKIRARGGWGGMIGVNKNADVAMKFACAGMHRGFVTHHHDIFTAHT